MFIDTHCHLNFKDYKDESLEIAQKTLDGGVYMIVVGSELKTSKRAVELADKFAKGVYCAIGLHPIHTQSTLVKNFDKEIKNNFETKAEEFVEKDYQNLIDTSSKVVAIGEIGLDYYHLKAENEKEEIVAKNKQKEILIKQLNFAKKNNLPVILHCREAHEDLFEILSEFKKNNNFSSDWGVIHCFSGDYDWAQKYFSLGLMISFNGLITFNHEWDDLIKKISLDKIMIETDAPYLTPVPYRGQRNEPLWVKEVAKKIAELRGEDLAQVEKKIWNNSLEFFKIEA